MPELKKYLPSFGMDGIRDLLPSRHLSLIVNARISAKGRTTGHHRSCFGNDQASTRPLTVILGHQGRGHMIAIGAAPSERSHKNAIWQL